MCVYHCAREGTIENREWKIGTREWKIGTREWKIGRRECSLEERTGKIERNLSQRKAFIKPWSQLGRERKQRLLKDILGTLQNVADHYDTSVICASSPQVQLLVNAISLFEMWRNLLFADRHPSTFSGWPMGCCALLSISAVLSCAAWLSRLSQN